MSINNKIIFFLFKPSRLRYLAHNIIYLKRVINNESQTHNDLQTERIYNY